MSDPTETPGTDWLDGILHDFGQEWWKIEEGQTSRPRGFATIDLEIEAKAAILAHEAEAVRQGKLNEIERLKLAYLDRDGDLEKNTGRYIAERLEALTRPPSDTAREDK